MTSNNMSSNQNHIMVNAYMLEEALTQYDWVTLCVAEIGSTDDDWNDIVVPTECLDFDHDRQVLIFWHPALRQYKVPYATLATAKPMPSGEIVFNHALALKCRVSGLQPAIVGRGL